MAIRNVLLTTVAALFVSSAAFAADATPAATDGNAAVASSPDKAAKVPHKGGHHKGHKKDAAKTDAAKTDDTAK